MHSLTRALCLTLTVVALSLPALAQTPPSEAPMPQNPGQWRHVSPNQQGTAPQRGQPGQRRGGQLGQKLAQLNLTQDQKQQIQGMIQAHRSLMRGASPDQRRQARRRLMQSIRGLLSQEQRSQLRAMNQGRQRPQGQGQGRRKGRNQPNQPTSQIG